MAARPVYSGDDDVREALIEAPVGTFEFHREIVAALHRAGFHLATEPERLKKRGHWKDDFDKKSTEPAACAQPPAKPGLAQRTRKSDITRWCCLLRHASSE
jgi:hypothetical protein